MDLGYIKENLQKITDLIDDVSRQSGRAEGSVKLLPVTKTQPIEKILYLYNLGIRAFGENRVQELAEKAVQLPGDIEWHLIGSLQSNKVKQALQFASYIHSIDSLKLLDRVDRLAAESGKMPKIFLQVNLSQEPQKGGFEPGEVAEAVEYAQKCKNLKLAGLMTIGKADATPAETSKIFANLASIKDSFSELTELSMGMSGDFLLAIPAGATYLRIGSLLLGERG